MKYYMLRIMMVLFVVATFLATGCATHPKPQAGMRAVDVPMEVTAYCSCGKCCNWKRNWLFKPVVASGPNAGKPKKVGITACGLKAKKGTIAADTDKYPFGTIMYIPGYGYGRVEDRGKAIKGKERIDIFFEKHKEALQWGRRSTKVRVWR